MPDRGGAHQLTYNIKNDSEAHAHDAIQAKKISGGTTTISWAGTITTPKGRAVNKRWAQKTTVCSKKFMASKSGNLAYQVVLSQLNYETQKNFPRKQMNAQPRLRGLC